MFPDETHIINAGTDKPQLRFSTLASDDDFRRDCAAYTENILQGRHDSDWLAAAWAAHERRKVGDFDDHLVREFEETWEVDLPEEYRPKRVLASQDDNGATSVETAEAKTTSKEVEDRTLWENDTANIEMLEVSRDTSNPSTELGATDEGKGEAPDTLNGVLRQPEITSEIIASIPKRINKRQKTRQPSERPIESEDELA